jgi:hypothetical protein
MSDEIQPEYATEVKLPHWGSKNGSLPSDDEVGDKFKALQDRQTADWKPGSTPLVPAPAPH